MTAPRWPVGGRAEKLRAERGPGVWRFKLIQERIEWTDGILGDLSIDAGSVSDPVLIRADGQVLYTLASVVDDMDMGITHVVRGSDHVTNTATQIQIIEALGGTPPTFAHHSLLTGPQGEALSKRLRTLSLRDLREAGVEPMALLSLMARLGSSQPVDAGRVAGRDRGGVRPDPFRRRADEVRRGGPLAADRACVAGDGRLARWRRSLRRWACRMIWPPTFWEVARANITRRGGTRRMVAPVPRRGKAAGRRRGPGVRGRGLRHAARSALWAGHLEPIGRTR
jgi:hypothetical protein